jgi:hypothetical protein
MTRPRQTSSAAGPANRLAGTLPHLLLGFGFTLVMAAAFSLQLSLLVVALAAGWAGARFGEWLSVTAGRSPEPAPVRPWVGRAATAALVAALAITFLYMLTAPPPL